MLDAVDELALALPLGTEFRFLFLEFGNLLVELGNLRLVALPLDGLPLNLELSQAAGNLVQFLR